MAFFLIILRNRLQVLAPQTMFILKSTVDSTLNKLKNLNPVIMCGIVAYIGNKQAYPIILKGLKRLEYRGYDSAGVALLNSGLNVYKKKGKVADLEETLVGKD